MLHRMCTPMVAQVIITPPRPIMVGMHTAIDGVLHMRQQYMAGAGVCCTFFVSCPLCFPISNFKFLAKIWAHDQTKTMVEPTAEIKDGALEQN